MSAISNTPLNRLDFRLSPEHKMLIERAASVQGQTVSSFAIATLLRAAEDALQRAAERTLSARDSSIFLSMLDADTEPSPALKSAAKKFKGGRGH